MLTRKETCRFHGSRAGCKYGTRCRYDHSSPEYVPLCRFKDQCVFGKKCMFRHHRRPSLLDQAPPDITELIFEWELRMEQDELSQRMNFEFHHQFDRLVLQERYNMDCEPWPDFSIEEGLEIYAYDVKYKIDEKYGRQYSSALKGCFGLNRVRKIHFTFLNPGPSDNDELCSADKEEDAVFSCDPMIGVDRSIYWRGLADKLWRVTKGWKYMKMLELKVISMPYKYQDRQLVSDGMLVLGLKYHDQPVFVPMDEYLKSLGNYKSPHNDEYCPKSGVEGGCHFCDNLREQDDCQECGNELLVCICEHNRRDPYAWPRLKLDEERKTLLDNWELTHL